MGTIAAVVYVFALWSLSTALIFYLDSLPMRTFKYSMTGATLVLLACACMMISFRNDGSTLAIACSFAAGLLAWGWTEMALYMGYITGPRKHRCAAGCSGPKHFGHAIGANLWHELVIIAFAVLIFLSGNATAFWCFTLLWLMHLSARLNVFLGVRNISEEFVPAHMEVLKGFLRRRNMNWLFPISSVSLLTLTVYFYSQPQTFSNTMATTLAAFGLLEHILLMLPLHIERLWHWSLSDTARKSNSGDNAEKPLKRTIGQHTAMGTLS
jgi:putative photosynthetic complex assembly protein 2